MIKATSMTAIPQKKLMRFIHVAFVMPGMSSSSSNTINGTSSALNMRVDQSVSHVPEGTRTRK